MKNAFLSLIVSIITIAITMTASSALAADKLIIAHRGASGYLPEHTLAAKALAHGMNADYLEQDIVLTRDGVPVVLHDRFLDTVTDVATRFPGRHRDNGRYYVIDFTLAEIKTLKVMERIDLKTGHPVFKNRFPAGLASFSVSTFEEELELVKGLNASTGKTVGIYPEIKAPAFHRKEGQDISKITLDILKKHGYVTKEDAVYLQCFDWRETRRIREELGYQGRLVQLIAANEWKEADVDFDALRTPQSLLEIAKVADGIGPWIPHIVNEDGTLSTLVSDAHAAGLDVHVYTLRSDELPAWAKNFDDLMEILLFKAGADGVFSDFPDLSVSYLSARP